MVLYRLISRIRALRQHYKLRSEEWTYRTGLALRSRFRTRAIANQPVVSARLASQIVSESISSGRPFLVSRLGETEARALNRWRTLGENTIEQELLRNLDTLSGVYPADELGFDEFRSIYLKSLEAVDLLAVRDSLDNSKESRQIEEEVIENFAPDTPLISWECLFPIKLKSPWTLALASKRVLVVHPFAHDIKQQHLRLNQVFPSRFLPSFELLSLAPPQLLGDSIDRQRWSSWSSALESTKREISFLDFDVALVAAGAMGLPIAAHCKGLGKPTIHIGGELQLFFGIIGRRWETAVALPRGVVNDAWIKPSPSARPNGYEKVERGGYW